MRKTSFTSLYKASFSGHRERGIQSVDKTDDEKMKNTYESKV